MCTGLDGGDKRPAVLSCRWILTRIHIICGKQGQITSSKISLIKPPISLPSVTGDKL